MHLDPVLGAKHWKILQRDPDLEEQFARSVPVSRVLSRILLNRGIQTPEQTQRFLNPDLDELYDPSLFDGMDRAVARTRHALDRREKIMVHGDYDVDGISGTALLVRVLLALGAEATWHVPHRQKEGYDIQPPAVEAAKEQGISLIITVDCGTSAVEAIEQAKTCGIDVVVTDHHEPGPNIVDAAAVINPRKPGCPYPFKDLAGVGVAFKFAEALVRECGYDTSAFRRKFVDLVAIGTVADIVPLMDENRTLVKFGLQEIPRSGKRGLRALLEKAGLATRPITSQVLAFVLAPRLNAAGRLDDASIALELLLTRDDAEAARLADALETCNKERRLEQERITREALEQIASRKLDETTKVLVLSSQGWHPGVVGIVAGKIVDRYGRPAVLVALDDSGDVGVGSARSIAAFDVFEALVKCGDLLDRYGGHSQAAGLSIIADKLPDFDSAINRLADTVLADSDLIPQIEIDAELDLDSVTEDFITELELLEPYGHCNREPVFVTENAMILQKNTMGATGAHLKMKLGTASGRPIECVGFGWGSAERSIRLGSLLNVCYNTRINDYRGFRTVQLVLRDARQSAAVIGDEFSLGNDA